MEQPIRIIRLIEITYPSQAAFERDRLLWQLPAQGTRRYGGTQYRTSVIDSTSLGIPNQPGDDVTRGSDPAGI